MIEASSSFTPALIPVSPLRPSFPLVVEFQLSAAVGQGLQVMRRDAVDDLPGDVARAVVRTADVDGATIAGRAGSLWIEIDFALAVAACRDVLGDRGPTCTCRFPGRPIQPFQVSRSSANGRMSRLEPSAGVWNPLTSRTIAAVASARRIWPFMPNTRAKKYGTSPLSEESLRHSHADGVVQACDRQFGSCRHQPPRSDM